MPPRPAEGSMEKAHCALTFNGLTCDRFNCDKRFQHTVARAGVKLGQYKPRQQPARPVRSTAVEATKDTGSTDERMSKIEGMLVKLAQQRADTHATAKPAAAVSSPAHPLTGLNAQQRKAAFVRLCESMPSDSEDDDLDNANKLAKKFALVEDCEHCTSRQSYTLPSQSIHHRHRRCRCQTQTVPCPTRLSTTKWRAGSGKGKSSSSTFRRHS